MGYTLRTKDNALDLGRAADQNESVDNDIFFNGVIGGGTAWTDYAAAPTGFAGALSIEYSRYKRMGDMVLISLRFAGTSNAVTKTCAAPIAASGVAADSAFDLPALIQNNTGAFAWGRAALQGGSSTINFYIDANATGWTAAGAAFIQVEAFYKVV